MQKTLFITTAIDYTNSAPHIGHAYEKILADVIARYHRIKGEPVFFLTGVDQHGQKVQQSADKEGLTPERFVSGVTQQFIRLWDKLDVRYDGWAATTDPLHKACVQAILQRLLDQKQLYKARSGGYYSVRQEQFLTDKDRGPDGEFGPEWGTVEFREEENYYFRLERHKEWLLRVIEQRLKAGNPFVVPEFREAELRNAVQRLSGDLCISRPRSRLSWGIQLPFDHEYVTYVWFDALTNYISFAGYDGDTDAFDRQPPHFREKWPALHVIGKDILVPAHGIYWPIMLHALGFPDDQIPTLLVHGWWNIGGAKMSKSLGNVVDPEALAQRYGAQPLRFYLMSDITTGKDADFSERRLIEQYNSDLANNIGNLVSRTINMVNRFCGGALDSARSDFISELQLEGETQVGRYKESADQFGIAAMLSAADCLSSRCNETIDREQPWKLAKDPARRERLNDVLYSLAETIRILAILLAPVIPEAAHRIFDQLNWKTELQNDDGRFSLEEAAWGKLPHAHVVGKPVPLFPRIEQV